MMQRILKSALFVIPVLLLGAFIYIALTGLAEDRQGKSVVASEGKMVPEMNMPTLNGARHFTNADMRGKLVMVNFFASWCVPCRAEHEFLMALKEAVTIPVIGIVYKDKKKKIKTYLDELGNPFTMVAVDEEGRNAIEWGVTGVPETFLVDGDGRILAHASGVLTIGVWDKMFRPHIPREAINAR